MANSVREHAKALVATLQAEGKIPTEAPDFSAGTLAPGADGKLQGDGIQQPPEFSTQTVKVDGEGVDPSPDKAIAGDRPQNAPEPKERNEKGQFVGEQPPEAPTAPQPGAEQGSQAAEAAAQA